ncbi:MAG: glutaminyl-peptide cyclotransferase [Saprospiraceae bacterium]|nr:glutaminyl-peptide cyclotransferase [Saprospiraceae bacterium]
MRFVLPVVLLFSLSLTSCKEDNKVKTPDNNKNETIDIMQPLNYSVSARLPHDVTSFTEGLLFHEGRLFEGTGSPQELTHTRSVIGPVDLKTGKIDVVVEIDRRKYFGEGICFLKGKLYQLTYKNQLCFIYDAQTFKNIGSFKYISSEGWGMTTDGKSLIMSDGTDKLTYINPETYAIEKEIRVTARKSPLFYINELEYINGYIYANVWTTTQIVKIDPSTGKVTGVMDLNPLQNEAKSVNPGSAELNGIAFNPVTGLVYVTGKLWPNIYQIDFSY